MAVFSFTVYVPKCIRSTTTKTTTSLFLILKFKYTNITLPANSKANRGRWCVDGLRFITIVEVKKDHIYNKKGQSLS